jgi:hypothetical protein
MLVLHDGELTDVTAALEPLGLSFTDRLGDLEATDCATRWDLLIASSTQMLASEAEFQESPVVRIAVIDGESRTLRALMRRVGSQLVIRRPVHPSALRLLVLYALYRGPEKRSATRVSVGASIHVRTRLIKRPAILGELSQTGCRLLVPERSRLQVDQKITLQIPGDVCEGRPLQLRGLVVRIARGDSGTRAVAVVFDGLRVSTEQRLAEIVQLHAEGPAILNQRGAGQNLRSTPVPEILDSEPTDEAERPDDERRGEPRRALSRRIIALSATVARVLIGRDLSRGGIRVNPTPGLKVGDCLQIALHVRTGGLPLVIKTSVIRDDGDDGIVLQFVDLDDDARTALEEMVESLPMIDDLEAQDAESAVFVMELVEKSAD